MGLPVSCEGGSVVVGDFREVGVVVSAVRRSRRESILEFMAVWAWDKVVCF